MASTQTQPELALYLIDQVRARGVPFSSVGADSGYMDNTNFLDELDSRQFGYVVVGTRDFGVCLPEEVAEAAERPLPAKKKDGRPHIHPYPLQVTPSQQAEAVLANQTEDTWQTIAWGMGSEGPLTKQFTVLRMRRGHDGIAGREGWLMSE